jgi:beta-galactosidase
MRQWTRRELVKVGAVAGAVSLTANGLAAEGIEPERGAAKQAKTPLDIVQVNVAKDELRERQSLDFGWRFALGHACDPMWDFGFGKLAGVGTYAKSGDAGGATGIGFDDSKWASMGLVAGFVQAGTTSVMCG